MLSSPVINKDKLHYCDNWLKKLRGLYFRNLDDQCFLISCNCIHTLFFFRDLDVAFLNNQKQVIKVVRGLKPFRILSCADAKFVFERFAQPGNDFLKLHKKIDI